MSKIKTFFKFMIVAGIVFGISFGVGASLQTYIMGRGADKSPSTTVPEVADGERTNILIMGIDARAGEKQTRTDTMIIASIDPRLNKAALVSIPRDTQIKVDGSPYDKINSANVVGGPDLAVKTVEKLMGENIDYYIEMDFKGFAKIIDTLGGVNINVDQVMYKPSEGIDLKPGQQILNGEQSLGFVRFRDYIRGDIDRTIHQQTFLTALGKEVLKPKNLIKFPGLIREAYRNVDTNLRLSDMLKMATWAPGFNGESIVAQTLPGHFLDKRDEWGNLTQSYWVADKKNTDGLLEKMLAGETVAVMTADPVCISAAPKAKPETPTENESESLANRDEDEINWERSRLPSPGHGINDNV